MTARTMSVATSTAEGLRPGHNFHAVNVPLEHVNQRRNLRESACRFSRLLRQHPALTASEVVIRGLATTPPFRLPAATDTRFALWSGFDAVVRCSTVCDVMGWYSSTDAASSLSVFVSSRGDAELELVTSINGGTYTVITNAAWLADDLAIRPGERRQVSPSRLTAALEARARQAAKRTAAVSAS